jgi:hypothetical protein
VLREDRAAFEADFLAFMPDARRFADAYRASRIT